MGDVQHWSLDLGGKPAPPYRRLSESELRELWGRLFAAVGGELKLRPSDPKSYTGFHDLLEPHLSRSPLTLERANVSLGEMLHHLRLPCSSRMSATRVYAVCTRGAFADEFSPVALTAEAMELVWRYDDLYFYGVMSEQPLWLIDIEYDGPVSFCRLPVVLREELTK
jgi:hypothetical protein